MTITASVKVSGGELIVKGRRVLTAVPDAVVCNSAASAGPVDGGFLGVDCAEEADRHVIPIGVFRNQRFMASFRCKLWWMAQKMGSQGSEIPIETQLLLIESKSDEEEETMYIVMLPLVEGPFRASLQGNADDQLELILESGDVDIRANAFSAAVYIGATASDPFAAVSNAVGAVKSHLKTFRRRTERRLPGIVDYFGWCTWDAFYRKVNPEGIESGLQSLTAGGTPPKFLIIDDGWQSIAADEIEKSAHPKLIGIKENSQFQSEADPAAGLRTIISAAKEKYGLKYVYVWHALAGYWGGVLPGVKGMEHYGSRMMYPKVSPGVAENEPGLKTDPLVLLRFGLIDPKNVHLFFNDMHKYLASAGVDGVKVDVQCMLETLGAGVGGRVGITKAYSQALEESVAKNFPDNGCVACMSHGTDALYCSKQTAVVRASDDFFPRDPMSHNIHIAAVAYNSVFLGEFMLPDWDMFHSVHPAAEYHASARAISGGPVYVSDAPGKHDFKLLRKLVLPDGSILRAQLPGRPTADVLFCDPNRDGKSLLKIWNMNKFTGILGVYNCQGASWSYELKKNVSHANVCGALSCGVKASDIHTISDASTDANWDGDCAIYRHGDGELVVLPRKAIIPVTLEILKHEIFTVTPIKVISPRCRFAPFGLVDMYNSGGAITSLSYETIGSICIGVKGCGRFGAYSSTKPRKCMLETAEIEFVYDQMTGFLTLQLENMPIGEKGEHRLTIEF